MNFKFNILECLGVGLSNYFLVEKDVSFKISIFLGKGFFLDKILFSVLCNFWFCLVFLGMGKDFVGI